MPQESSPRFFDSPPCPTCDGRGRAHRVSVKAEERTVSYECDTCQHKWDLTTEDPPVSWTGQPANQVKV
jgi:hypothetical protein